MKYSKIFNLCSITTPSGFKDRDVKVVFILGDYGKSSTSEIIYSILKEKKIIVSNFNDHFSVSNNPNLCNNVYDSFAFFTMLCVDNVPFDIALCEVSNEEMKKMDMEKFISGFEDAIVLVNNIDSGLPTFGDKKINLFQHTKNISKRISNKKNLIVNTGSLSDEFNNYFQNRTKFFRFNSENSDVFGTSEKVANGILISLNIIKEKIESTLKSSTHFQNIIAAISVLIALDMFNLSTVSSVLKNIMLVNRFDEITVNNKRVIFDKSTESATSLYLILKDLNLEKDKTTVIMSATSYSDKSKNRNKEIISARKRKFQVAEEAAKNIILTNNNYDDEQTYIANLDFNGDNNYIRDRFSAISQAFEQLEENGTLIILGGDLEKDREIIEQFSI